MSNRKILKVIHPKKPTTRIEAAAGDELFQFNACGTVEIQAAADGIESGVPSFTLLGYTGGVMSVWRGATVIDLAGLSLPKSVPVLHDHDASDPVGHGTPSIEGSNLTLSGTFSVAESASAQKIIASSKRSFPWQASVGVAVAKFEKAAAGQEVSVNGQTFTAGNDGLYVIRAGSLREISIVPLGADTNTTVNVAASAANTPQETKMNEFEKWLQAGGFDPATVTEAQKVTLKATYDAEQKKQPRSSDRSTDDILASARRERDRCSKIAALVEEAASTPGADLDALTDLSASAIAEKWTLQDTELAILRATRPKPPRRDVSGGFDRPELMQDRLTAAAMISAGNDENDVAKTYGDQATSGALKAYGRNIGLQEMILTAAKANGYVGRDRVTESNYRQLLDWSVKPQVQAAGFSTIDLSSILGAVANKALASVQAEPTWLVPFLSAARSHTNFHSHTVLTPQTTGLLPIVGPGGEIEHLQMSEESYTRQVATYAAMLRISRTDIVNDDLGVFSDNAAQLSRKAFRTREKALLTKIMASAAGASHFTAARGNYVTGGGTALSIAALDNALKAFRNTTGPDGDPIMIEPKYLLVPPTLEATARQLVAPMSRLIATDHAAAGAVLAPDANIYAGRFEVLTSAYLELATITGYSTAYWYLLADPAVLPCYEVSYLNGNQAPTVNFFGLETDPNTLGMAWRIFWDFGADAAQWRAGVKSAGA